MNDQDPLARMADFIERGKQAQKAINEILAVHGFEEDRSSIPLSQWDRDNVGELLSDRSTHFGAHLMRLIAKADFQQRATLALVYPEHVEAFERWQAAPCQPSATQPKGAS